MPVITKLKYLRIAPRKVRLVADLIRGKKVEQAQDILNFTVKKSAKPILKLLNSAVANARNNFQLDSNNLYISKITVDQGPKYKRWMPRARGRVSEIQKKSSHITLILNEIASAKKIKKPKVKHVSTAVRRKGEKLEKIEKKKIISEVKNKREEVPELKKPKPRPEIERPKPKSGVIRGIKKVFRRKAF